MRPFDIYCLNLHDQRPIVKTILTYPWEYIGKAPRTYLGDQESMIN